MDVRTTTCALGEYVGKMDVRTTACALGEYFGKKKWTYEQRLAHWEKTLAKRTVKKHRADSQKGYKTSLVLLTPEQRRANWEVGLAHRIFWPKTEVEAIARRFDWGKCTKCGKMGSCNDPNNPRKLHIHNKCRGTFRRQT